LIAVAIGCNNIEPPLLGAYGYDPPGDTKPDPVTVNDSNSNPTGIDISAQNPPPH
jgi:hypothetical protein